jgi:hypothetical protein
MYFHFSRLCLFLFRMRKGKKDSDVDFRNAERIKFNVEMDTTVKRIMEGRLAYIAKKNESAAQKKAQTASQLLLGGSVLERSMGQVSATTPETEEGDLAADDQVFIISIQFPLPRWGPSKNTIRP